VPMREECKNYQSRTYASGEVARICTLDLAPEAPWRCPDNCAKYSRRLADAGWTYGSLVEPAIEDEPDEPAEEVGSVLDAAEDIVNAVVPTTRAEVAREQARTESSFGRLTARFRRRRPGDSS
jgi:hypothetical protein